jgi:hypothetical protein
MQKTALHALQLFTSHIYTHIWRQQAFLSVPGAVRCFLNNNRPGCSREDLHSKAVAAYNSQTEPTTRWSNGNAVSSSSQPYSRRGHYRNQNRAKPHKRQRNVSTTLHGVASKYTLPHNVGKAQKKEGYEWRDREWYSASEKSPSPIHPYRKVYHVKQEYKVKLEWNTCVLQMPYLKLIYTQFIADTNLLLQIFSVRLNHPLPPVPII